MSKMINCELLSDLTSQILDVKPDSDSDMRRSGSVEAAFDKAIRKQIDNLEKLTKKQG